MLPAKKNKQNHKKCISPKESFVGWSRLKS